VTVFAGRADLAFFFPAVWRAFGFDDGRALERDLPLPLLLDAAAFNCFPLFGLTPPGPECHGLSAHPFPDAGF
jgi:hypothetical protein